MDLPAFTISNDAQDQGKGQVDPDHPAVHVGYSAVYLHEQPVSMVPAWDLRTPRSRGRRSWVHFIHWVMLYFILFLIIVFTYKDLRNVARAVESIFRAGHVGAGVDDREVHLPHDCVEVIAWDQAASSGDYSHVAQASVDLPVSSDLLYLVSHGYLSHGTVQFVATDSQDSHVASIDVTYHYDNDELSDLLKVCRLHRAVEKNGVGIFSPEWTHGHPKNHHSHVDVVVKLPSGAAIKNLETHMPNFSHDLDDFRDSVTFGSVSLSATNHHINAKYLFANRTHLQTSNARVAGVFNSTQSIDIFTSNAIIDGEFNLSNDERPGFSRPSTINLATSNARIKADIALTSTSANQTRGVFNVKTTTSNAQLDVKFNDAPVLSHLFFRGRTTNGQAIATLHETYEGAFSESTSRWFEAGVHVDETKKDPSGTGRQRHVSGSGTQRGHAEGKVVWGGSASERRMSFAELTTTNSPVHFYL